MKLLKKFITPLKVSLLVSVILHLIFFNLGGNIFELKDAAKTATSFNQQVSFKLAAVNNQSGSSPALNNNSSKKSKEIRTQETKEEKAEEKQLKEEDRSSQQEIKKRVSKRKEQLKEDKKKVTNKLKEKQDSDVEAENKKKDKHRKKERKKQITGTKKIKDKINQNEYKTSDKINQNNLKKKEKGIKEKEANQEEQKKEVAVKKESQNSKEKIDLTTGDLITGVTPPALIKKQAPNYPALMRKREIEGRVVLKILITKEGQVNKIKIKQSSGYQKLDSAAKKAVNEWQFKAAKLEDEKVGSWVLIPIRFSLAR